MHHQLTENAVTTQLQSLVFPFVIQSHKVVVLLCLMDAGRYFRKKIVVVRLHQSLCCVEERHRTVDADTHVDPVFLGYLDDVCHVFERVPGRKTEHQRYRQACFTGLDHLHHLVVSISAAHI